jgi:asparagine synthase (glutamine-hydrolysing)
MPDGILYKVDRMSMAHAVEVRPPFLDPRIVAFAARLPQRFKIDGLETKVALRRLMRDSLPPSVLAGPRSASTSPFTSGSAASCARCCWTRSTSAP